jgi:DNA-binding response OmpR family regulator
MKLGAFDYLLKPVKFEELLAKLAAALEKRVSQEKKSGRP